MDSTVPTEYHVEQIILIARFVLALTFILAGSSKLLDMRSFILGILDFAILPPKIAVFYANILPVAEILSGMALLLAIWIIPAALVTNFMLATFLVAVTINLARGRKINCHCFGVQDSDPISWFTVIRIFLLMAAATITIVEIIRGTIVIPPPWEPVLPSILIAIGIAILMVIITKIPFILYIRSAQAPRRISPYRGRVSLRSAPMDPDWFGRMIESR